MCLGIGKAMALPWQPSCRIGTDIPSSHKTLPVPATHPRAVPSYRKLCFSISQVIPLQSGLQVTVKLQGGLGLDISADMDVSFWEQELKTSVSARSVGKERAWLWEWEYLGGEGGFPQLPALLLVGPAFSGGCTHIFHGQTSN